MTVDGHKGRRRIVPPGGLLVGRLNRRCVMSQTQMSSIVNGVDVGRLMQTIQAIRQQPAH